MRTELFLAKRYLRPRRNAVSLITLSSILGVTLGVAVLIVVLAVMTGFTDLMKTKLLETQAHFQLRPGPFAGVITRPGQLIEMVRRHPGADAAAVIASPVIVQVDRHLDPQMLVMGVDRDALATRLLAAPEVAKEGRFDLEHGEAILGRDTARRLRVKIGDKILLHTQSRLTGLVDFKPEGGVAIKDDAEAYLPMEFTVTGTFSVGKYDFDSRVMFLGIDDAAELFELPWGSATAVYGWGPNPFSQRKLIESLREECGNRAMVYTWEEDNKQLLDILAVEKNMMFFLLIFIVLVAAFSITNTLITSVYQKTREIGVLKALGASDWSVTWVFIFQGFLIGVLGSACGTALGVAVIGCRRQILKFASQTFGMELFPKQFYYFDELPAHIVASDVALIVGAAVVLCTVGALLPALRAAKLDPAKALRYE